MRRRKTLFGCDLGGTKIAVALYNAETFEEQSREQIPTDAKKGLKSALERAALIMEKMKRGDTEAIGFGIAGLVREPGGNVLDTPNIPGGNNLDIVGFLTKKFGLPVHIANDSGCFALAEAVMGSGKGHSAVVGISMGTGVGGGIVIDGKLWRGAHGFAGEIGHMLLMPGNPPYSGGHRRGDVEQFLSGTALGHRCTAAKRPQDYLEGEVCSFLRPEVARETAWLVASLTHVIDPSIIVFGGSTGRALGSLLPAIEKELQAWLLPGVPTPKLAIAQRHDAGTLGAALLTRSA